MQTQELKEEFEKIQKHEKKISRGCILDILSLLLLLAAAFQLCVYKTLFSLLFVYAAFLFREFTNKLRFKDLRKIHCDLSKLQQKIIDEHVKVINELNITIQDEIKFSNDLSTALAQIAINNYSHIKTNKVLHRIVN